MTVTRRVCTDVIATPFEVRIVDRRAQYQAKVRNAGLHTTTDFKVRAIRGTMVKYGMAVRSICADASRFADAIRTFDWQPVVPRPDAPPSPRGSAAA